MGRSRSRSRSRSRGRERRHYSRSRSRSRSASEEKEGFRVHVSDLGIDCDKKEIEHCFEKFGPLVEVWLAKNPPCFAFIVFAHHDDAEDAIHEMDGKMLCGGRVRVSYARPRTRGMRRRRGFDQNLCCYQCGGRGHFSRDCDSIWSYRKNRYSRSRSRSKSRDRRRPRRENEHERSRSRDRSRRNKSRERSGSRDKSRREKSRTASPSRRRSGEGHQEEVRSPRQRSSDSRTRRDSSPGNR